MSARLVGGLIATFFTLGPSLAISDTEWIGTYVWERPESYFGGLSGIEVSEDGVEFLAIGDNAQTIRGKFTRTEGQITGAEAGWIGALRGSSGAPLFESKSANVTDSEGLAGSVDGPFYVSFEQKSRVWRYDILDGPAIPLPYYPPLNHWRGNTSLEAAAIDPAGTLYVIPEGRRSRMLAFPIYRFHEGVWDKPFQISSIGRYYPVGADFGPDGRLYVLERRHHGFLRFSSRIRSWRIEDETLADERTVLNTKAGEFDNLEGLALWRDGQGKIRMTLISDDNYLELQETQIVEFRLTE